MPNTKTLATASNYASAFGVGLQAYGAYQKGVATETAYDMQSQVEQNNAAYAEQQARDALDRGQEAVRNKRLETKQLKGSQRAALAANGIDLSQGSALNILTDTDLMGAHDAEVLRMNAAREAYGHQVNAGNDRANAALYGYRSSAENPALNAGTTLLMGAGSVAKQWYSSKATRATI